MQTIVAILLGWLVRFWIAVVISGPVLAYLNFAAAMGGPFGS